MYHTLRKYLVLLVCMLFVTVSPLNPSHVIQAEEPAPFMWKDQAIDTLSSVYPQIEFEQVPADNVFDSIVIKPETLFSNAPIRVKNVTTFPKFTTDLVDNQSYRDFTTFSIYYIKHSDRSVDVLSPSIHIDAAQNLFKPLHFIETQAYDVAYKSEGSFLKHYTQDPYEMYALTRTIPLSLVADAKADFERAKHIYSLIPNKDPDYQKATELLTTIENDTRLLALRYETAHSAEGLPKVTIHPDVTNVENANQSKTLIEQTLQTLPLDIRQRLAEIKIVPASYIANISGSSDIQGYAFTNRTILISDSYHLEPALIYHEIGHIVDFSSYVYKDAALEEYIGFSNSPEWLAIHEKEWNIDGSYYSVPLESFAQAFAGYMLERIEGVQLSHYGYVDTDIATRPETRAYFDQLFTKLGLSQ